MLAVLSLDSRRGIAAKQDCSSSQSDPFSVTFTLSSTVLCPSGA